VVPRHRHTQSTLPLECHCWVEYAASFLQPFCPLPVQRKFGVTVLSDTWTDLKTYLWPLGTHKPTLPSELRGWSEFEAHLAFARRSQARKRWSEHSAASLRPRCPLPEQRKFEITELSALWNYFGTYRWPLGANGPPPIRVSLLE
jgi:hypothetical protein